MGGGEGRGTLCNKSKVSLIGDTLDGHERDEGGTPRELLQQGLKALK